LEKKESDMSQIPSPTEVQEVLVTELSPEQRLPVEPLYLADIACQLIPCSRSTLYTYLKRGGFEPRYRWWRTRRYRMISASEIRYVRDLVVRPTLRLDRILDG
jgi:hypothetical protein